MDLWKQAKDRLPALFPDATLRGQVKGRLLQIPLPERLEYFEDDDIAVRETLKALLPDAAGNDFVTGHRVDTLLRLGRWGHRVVCT